MRKLILLLSAVLFCFTLSYAESCSCGQGCLSYQISGCGERKRACCSGQWCSWGTAGCASCTATIQDCSGNVTNACACNRTRTVTGICGSCSYGAWNDGGCSYTQTCTSGKVYCRDIPHASTTIYTSSQPWYYNNMSSRTAKSATVCGSASNCDYTYTGSCFCEDGYIFGTPGCYKGNCYDNGNDYYAYDSDYYKFTDYQSCMNLYNSIAVACTLNAWNKSNTLINKATCGTVCGKIDGFYRPCSNRDAFRMCRCV